MWFRCLGCCGAWLIVALIGLQADGACAEDNRYAVSWAVANAGERSDIATVTTPRSSSAQYSSGYARWDLSPERKRFPGGKLFNRVSVGKTFDGFGLRWEAGQLELALTDEGVGARWEF